MLVVGRWIRPREMLKEGTLGRLLRVNMRRDARPVGLIAPQPFVRAADRGERVEARE